MQIYQDSIYTLNGNAIKSRRSASAVAKSNHRDTSGASSVADAVFEVSFGFKRNSLTHCYERMLTKYLVC